MDYETRKRNISPLKQDAVKRLDKLREYVLQKVYKGYEDVYYEKAFNEMLDIIDEAKQCLIHGYDKNGQAV